MLPVVFVTFFMFGGWNRQTKQPPHNLSGDATTESSSMETMKSSLAQDRKLLAGYEREQSALRAEVIRRRRLFQDGQISKDQVLEAERSFIAALTRVHAMRDSVTETDIAITEAVLGEKVLRMPVLPLNGYSETAELARFNGGFKWSLKEASRVERFFSKSFGRSL
ncbi:MAG TPA: hypothetical protein VGK65_09605, partial [Candidatus Binatia bacterium]